MEKCECCKIIKGCGEGYQKKLVELDGGWVLSHCGAGEKTYLGRLILQTKIHIHDFDKLGQQEQESLGTNIKLINEHLRKCWTEMFPEDPIELIHCAYLNETPYIHRHTYLWNKAQLFAVSHVHMHLLTRTQKMGEALGYCAEKIGWHLLDYVAKFPDKYKVTSNNDERVIRLMNKLKKLFGNVD